MMHVSDPLDRLRAVNPVPSAASTLAPPDLVLFRRITAGEPPTVRPQPSRRRARRFVPAVLVASLLGGAAAYAVLRDGVTKPQTVACHERADVQSHTDMAVVDERGPVAACLELWVKGAFGAGVEVPVLTECVLDSGVAGVFPAIPGQDVCARLNLPAVTPTPAPATVATTAPGPAPGPPPADVNARVLAFRDAIFPQFVGNPCVDPRAAATVVRRELDRAGLGDWTIRGGQGLAGDGFSADRPCATLSVRPEAREVVLVPSERR